MENIDRVIAAYELQDPVLISRLEAEMEQGKVQFCTDDIVLVAVAGQEQATRANRYFNQLSLPDSFVEHMHSTYGEELGDGMMALLAFLPHEIFLQTYQPFAEGNTGAVKDMVNGIPGSSDIVGAMNYKGETFLEPRRVAEKYGFNVKRHRRMLETAGEKGVQFYAFGPVARKDVNSTGVAMPARYAINDLTIKGYNKAERLLRDKEFVVPTLRFVEPRELDKLLGSIQNDKPKKQEKTVRKMLDEYKEKENVGYHVVKAVAALIAPGKGGYI